jgi:trimethylamine--corrinoid protein Co-methyltransferase
MKTYNRDNYMTNVFNKWGISKAENEQKSNLSFISRQMLESRIASYVLPERSDAQKKILQPHLPSQCRY